MKRKTLVSILTTVLVSCSCASPVFVQAQTADSQSLPHTTYTMLMENGDTSDNGDSSDSKTPDNSNDSDGDKAQEGDNNSDSSKASDDDSTSEGDNTSDDSNASDNESALQLIKKNGYIYCYENGQLQTKCFKTIDNQLYYFDKNGRAKTGWFIHASKLYNADKTGCLRTSTTFKGVRLSSDGSALASKRSKEVRYAIKHHTFRWYTYKNGTYCVSKNGNRKTGSRKVDGKYYIFDNEGKLCISSGKKLIKLGSSYYGVSKKGSALKGWHVISNKLYYFQKDGKAKCNTSYKGVTFTSKCYAKSSIKVKAKIKANKIYRSITNSSMSKAEKLRACWNYMISRSRFTYYSRTPDNSKKNWQYESSYIMFTTHLGSCNNFATGFAALAEECGYDATIIFGRVSGSRDHAADGLTRHYWVKINGLYYDPEGKFAGWYTSCYGSSSYSVRHQTLKAMAY